MTPEQYDALAQQGNNRIPLSLEILADLDTPLSTYLKLANQPYSYLLESVHGGEKWGRYSIIGLPCKTLFQVRGHQVQILSHDPATGETRLESETEAEDPLASVEAFQQQFKAAELDDLPRFNGGLVGYFGYDTVRYIEPRLEPGCPPDEIGTPDILLMVSDELLVFDNLSGKITFIVHVDPSQPNAYENGQARLQELANQLHDKPMPDINPQPVEITEADFVSGYGEQPFYDAVEKIKEYIMAGDIMQAVISQRMTIPYASNPLNLYRALRSLNPSPYMYYLDLDDFHIVGSSPEILARLEDGEVTIRPIAGTRKRGATDEQDQAMEEELLNDPKEIAEHLMLIDLGRNDAGRVSEIGSVKVTDQMVVERYSHVMHIVSNVTGKLLPGKTAMDVLRAAHPAGTLSGAPKIRAMEILDSLEPVKRGIYGGAVGYLSFSGNMDMAIAIRTAVIKDQKLYIQAGAGVVADSIPRLEWKETMNKARAVFSATQMAARGLKHGLTGSNDSNKNGKEA